MRTVSVTVVTTVLVTGLLEAGKAAGKGATLIFLVPIDGKFASRDMVLSAIRSESCSLSLSDAGAHVRTPAPPAAL